jgi:hypothetical protein
MATKWKCPWCSGVTSRLKVRVVAPRWYLSRTVLVCPRCDKTVRHPKKKEAWLLLMLPLLFAFVYEAAAERATPIPVAAYVALVVVALAGVVLFQRTSTLEKDNAI